jgi:hypothetical protein
MGSQHADPALTVRPPAKVKTSAEEVLEARGLEMRAFVVACLATLAAEPDVLLDLIGKRWPEPKPRGRPRPSVMEPQENSHASAVAAGQLWVDNDKRSGRTRFVHVTGLTPDGSRAECQAWYDEPGNVPRSTAISVSRFKPTSSGYRLATPAERRASGVDDPA